MPKKKDFNLTLRLHRDPDGSIRPFEGLSPILNIPVKILPLTYGDARALESFGEALHNWSDIDKITVINDHVLEPEIDIKDVDDLYENYDAWTIEDLVQAVFMYSGLGRLYDPSLSEGNWLGEVEQES